MRLATLRQGDRHRLAVEVDQLFLDLERWSHLHSGVLLPSDMLAFIALGDAGLRRAHELVAIFQSKRGQDLEQLVESGVATPVERAQLAAPIPRPHKNIVCLGLNYVRHALESARAKGVPDDKAIPSAPLYFTKAPTAVIGPQDSVPFDSQLMTQLDWEVELAFVIGKKGRDIPAARAMDHVFGYTVVNDLSERGLQNRSGQFFHGKTLDGLCPMGPVIVTADDGLDPHRLRIETRVNGVRKQQSSTADFIFNIPAILADFSRGITLEPGDIFSTGTPEGVGFARKPPEFLKAGDVVETEIEGIGVLRNRMVPVREVARV
jgi:2-keto-4-pentenoate hydratase/2-oxohepta-3-ene-1,7-dioic acid hydratase in catechol pathway